MSKKILGIIWGVVLICVLVFSLAQFSEKQQTIETSSTSSLSNKKIEWGIKRGKNHEQPDVGEENKRIINKYDEAEKDTAQFLIDQFGAETVECIEDNENLLIKKDEKIIAIVCKEWFPNVTEKTKLSDIAEE